MACRFARPVPLFPVLAILAACAPSPAVAPGPAVLPLTPAIRVCYLGHSSFVFAFDNGVTILTDYGESNAYGLASPIHDLGGLQPTVVTYSHHHADHDRGRSFPRAKALQGQNLSLKGIELEAIPVSENRPGDNCGYLITYRGKTLFHAGDAQGDIVALPDEGVRDRLKQRLPARLDVLLVPIGWTRPMVQEAAAFVDSVRPRAVIPMHYWSREEKASFLDLLRTRGGRYAIAEQNGSDWEVAVADTSSSTRVISLEPGPCGR